jgi:ABC-type amino acid transport substrate-binding protein
MLRLTSSARAVALLALATAASGQPANPTSGAAARIRTAGVIRIGYRTDARPFAYRDESGNAAGYSVELCRGVAESLRNDLRLPALRVDWIPVTVADRFAAIQRGEVDLLCGAESVTLGRRSQVSFSTPIFPGGVAALVRADAPARLREVLTGRGQTFRPTWRATALQVLRAQTFAAVRGTTGARWLDQRRAELQIESNVMPVDGYDAGVAAVADRHAGAFFAERATLLDAARRHAPSGELIVLDRQYTYEPLALVVARGDDVFRLLVDRALGRRYAAPGFGNAYARWFGEPDQATIDFFRWNALPE